MAVSLRKGQGVSLRKSDYDLSQVTIGLGWDVNEAKGRGFLGGLLGQKVADYDLDVIAFLCNAEGKVANLGEKQEDKSLRNGDIVFFNALRHASGCVWLTGDNRTGEGEGDDEQIIARLNDLPAQYHKLVFIIQIYNGIENKQSFGDVRNAFIRAVDAQGHEMARFDLSGGQEYASARSFLFAELEREGDGWQFRAIGTPSQADSFVDWLKQYI